jgi:hypothetical protein
LMAHHLNEFHAGLHQSQAHLRPSLFSMQDHLVEETFTSLEHLANKWQIGVSC